MEIKLNGETKKVNEGATLLEILKSEGVENTSMVSVQLNGEFVEAAALETTIPKAGDELDFLFFMGGGK